MGKKEKQLFDMVYQWGRVGMITDENCPAFQDLLNEIQEEKILKLLEMRLKKQKEEIEKEVEERISKLEQIRCDEMLEKQKEEMEREIKLWFNMFMVDKSVRIDVRGITCLKDLLRRLRKL